MEEDEDLRLFGRSCSSPLWNRRENENRNGNKKYVRFYDYDIDEAERLGDKRFTDNVGASTSCFSDSSRRVTFNSDKVIENELCGYKNTHTDISNFQTTLNPKPQDSATALINTRNKQYGAGTVKRSNEKEEPVKKIWLTALPAGMERNIIMNPGPMTGKKYRKRLKKALTDRLDDAECMLNCKILRTDESYSNNKETRNARNSDRELEIVSTSSTLMPSIPGLENSNDVHFIDRSVEKCSISKTPTISEETRLSNIKNQAKMKLNKLNHQLNYLDDQFNILSNQGVVEVNDERISQLYKTRQLQRKIKEQISSLEKTLQTIEDVHQAEAAINFGTRSVKNNTLKITESNSSSRYIFYDGGDHICKLCSELFTEVESLIKHVYDAHINFFLSLPPENRPWAEPQTQVEENRNCQKRPFKGCEFLLPCPGFFCDLCKINTNDEATAKKHLESELHNKNYARYCELNPNYEKEMEAELKRSKMMKERIEELQTFSTENYRSSNFQGFDVPSRLSMAVDSPKDDCELIWLSDSEEATVEDRFEADEFAYIPDQDESNDVDLLEDQCLKSVTT